MTRVLAQATVDPELDGFTVYVTGRLHGADELEPRAYRFYGHMSDHDAAYEALRRFEVEAFNADAPGMVECRDGRSVRIS